MVTERDYSQMSPLELNRELSELFEQLPQNWKPTIDELKDVMDSLNPLDDPNSEEFKQLVYKLADRAPLRSTRTEFFQALNGRLRVLLDFAHISDSFKGV